MFDLLVAGGKVVTGQGVCEANIGIKGDKIAAILSKDEKVEAVRTIDATGKIVIPGAIDAHVHYRGVTNPFSADPFETVATSAAYGGITTFLPYVDMSRPGKVGESGLYRTLEAEGLKVEEHFPPLIEEYERSAVIDFAIHPITPGNEEVIRQIPKCIDMGITAFKTVLGYHMKRGWTMNDYILTLLMDIIAANGGLAMFHCENAGGLSHLEDKYVAEGRYTAENFNEARPNILEAECVYRVICLGRITGCPMYIVHLSAREGLEEIIRAKARGVDIIAEVLPQHLLFTQEDMNKQKALLKSAPPLRTAEDTEAMWRGIQQGFISVVASDHAPYTLDKKLEAASFHEAPFGAPGIETLLPLLYSQGVAKGRITLTQMVKILCENPAKIFGLYPKKGTIMVGSDADLVMIDPTIKWTIKAENLHSNAGYTPYEGFKMVGKPTMSLLRGEVMLEDGQLRQRPGFGRFLRCSTPQIKIF